tara:strand:+ start:98 stop:457 length:360 start_codon:yes stop_codon:yes gene_type:complete
MAAPNIVNVSTILGKTNVLQMTTSETAIVTNASSSGKVYKINSLILANKNGGGAANTYVSLYRGGVTYYLAYTVAVPADATLVAIAKDANIYLEEGDELRVWASSSSYVDAVCSYEVIS